MNTWDSPASRTHLARSPGSQRGRRKLAPLEGALLVPSPRGSAGWPSSSPSRRGDVRPRQGLASRPSRGQRQQDDRQLQRVLVEPPAPGSIRSRSVRWGVPQVSLRRSAARVDLPRPVTRTLRATPTIRAGAATSALNHQRRHVLRRPSVLPAAEGGPHGRTGDDHGEVQGRWARLRRRTTRLLLRGPRSFEARTSLLPADRECGREYDLALRAGPGTADLTRAEPRRGGRPCGPAPRDIDTLHLYPHAMAGASTITARGRTASSSLLPRGHRGSRREPAGATVFTSSRTISWSTRRRTPSSTASAGTSTNLAPASLKLPPPRPRPRRALPPLHPPRGAARPGPAHRRRALRRPPRARPDRGSRRLAGEPVITAEMARENPLIQLARQFGESARSLQPCRAPRCPRLCRPDCVSRTWGSSAPRADRVHGRPRRAEDPLFDRAPGTRTSSASPWRGPDGRPSSSDALHPPRGLCPRPRLSGGDPRGGEFFMISAPTLAGSTPDPLDVRRFLGPTVDRTATFRRRPTGHQSFPSASCRGAAFFSRRPLWPRGEDLPPSRLVFGAGGLTHAEREVTPSPTYAETRRTGRRSPPPSTASIARDPPASSSSPAFGRRRASPRCGPARHEAHAGRPGAERGPERGRSDRGAVFDAFSIYVARAAAFHEVRGPHTQVVQTEEKAFHPATPGRGLPHPRATLIITAPPTVEGPEAEAGRDRPLRRRQAHPRERGARRGDRHAPTSIGSGLLEGSGDERASRWISRPSTEGSDGYPGGARARRPARVPSARCLNFPAETSPQVANSSRPRRPPSPPGKGDIGTLEPPSTTCCRRIRLGSSRRARSHARPPRSADDEGVGTRSCSLSACAASCRRGRPSSRRLSASSRAGRVFSTLRSAECGCPSGRPRPTTRCRGPRPAGRAGPSTGALGAQALHRRPAQEDARQRDRRRAVRRGERAAEDARHPSKLLRPPVLGAATILVPRGLPRGADGMVRVDLTAHARCSGRRWRSRAGGVPPRCRRQRTFLRLMNLRKGAGEYLAPDGARSPRGEWSCTPRCCGYAAIIRLRDHADAGGQRTS